MGDGVRRVLQLYGTAYDTVDGVWMCSDPSRPDFLHTIDFTVQHRVVRSIYLGWTID